MYITKENAYFENNYKVTLKYRKKVNDFTLIGGDK